MIDIKWKVLRDGVVIPSHAHETDSGVDLRAAESGEITFGKVSLIPTGLAVQLPEPIAVSLHENFLWMLVELHVRSRSGLAVREGITCLTGTVDNGYRGEINLVLTKTIPGTYSFIAGERLAQGVLSTVLYPRFARMSEVDELTETLRGGGGFGSTGTG